jgi:tetratricopeptide (TPR) repeat protein
MSAEKPRSLQDILKSRQQEEFVGREEQLAFFSRNLRWEIDDPRRRFIINVSGQGGVGKTWLLRRFHKIAEEAGVITACTDEIEEDVPSVMGRFTEQFEAQGHPLKTFAERYKVYRQRWQEIEADPEARSAFPARLGRAMTKGSLDLARIVPGVGAFVELLDEEPIVSKGGEFAAYVARKLRNKEEVHLVLKPVEVLTPLFLADLREVAEKHPIALLFDTYERTGNFLDSWLRELLEGRHGSVPVDILVVVAGRDELDRNHWAPYGGVLARLSLEPFTEEETRDYLARKGITNERVVEVILGLSGRLPLLVATLAAESPDDPEKVGDPSGEAVERFLKWVEDPRQRQVALDAALPRRLNQDVLAVLVREEEANSLFAWLREMPFVERRGDCWAYHDVVRAQMLRHKRQEAPRSWADLHRRLAEYYEDLRGGLELEEEASRKDETWQGHALEALYHRLCQAPQTQLAGALNGFLAALKAQRSFARRWAEVVCEAGEEIEASSVQPWGQRLVEGLKAYEEDRYQEAAKMFTALLDRADLETCWRAAALDWRGYVHYLADQYEEALADLGEAVRLVPEEAEYWADRAETYRLMERYEEALADLNRAIELKPDYAWAIASRGETYRQMERYEEALADFNRAIELDSDYAWAIASRGQTYGQMERYEESLADFNCAIELKPDDAVVIANRGVTYGQMERYEEALSDFNCAIELKPDDAVVIANRGVTYVRMERYEEALTDFNRAIELKPDDAVAIANRGETYRLMERCDEALADFDRAIELKSDYDWAIASRGVTYRQMERYDEALADFDRAIELKSDYDWAIASRGLTYRQMERYDEALADFDRAIELKPDYDWAIANRGETYRLMERYDEALADFNRAIELKPDRAWAISRRGETYQLMERYDKALADFNQAIKLNPEDTRFFALRGLTYQWMERYDEALADFNRAIELAPNDAWAISRRGFIYQLMAQYEEALVDFDQALEVQPDNLLFLAMRLGALMQKGDTAEIATICTTLGGQATEFVRQLQGVLTKAPFKIVELQLKLLASSMGLDSDTIQSIVEQGLSLMGGDQEEIVRVVELGMVLVGAEMYRRSRQFEQALLVYDRLVESDASEQAYWAGRGETYRLMERYDEALADFNCAIELEPDYTWAIACRGETYRGMERYEEALANFDRVIELMPDYVWAIASRGETRQLIERYEEALADFNRAIELDPDYAWAIALRGKTYRQIERYDDALVDFNRAIELDPDYTWAIAFRGETYRLMKRYDAALADFNHAIELKPDDDWYLYSRALTYQVLDQADTAQADLRVAIQYARNKYDTDAKYWRNTFNLALYHLAAGEVEEAERLYRVALAGGASPYLVREAIRDLDDFLGLFPDHPQACAIRDLLQKHLQEAERGHRLR